ncbi:formyltransferase family protein [Amycolatopsis sp. NPDC054798]
MTAYDCQLIGWGALLVESAELLTARGHRVTGVVTRYPPALDWAREHGVPAAARLAELPSRPDYLFSITNDVLLRAEDLALPRRMAINLHSSLLPKYAGVHQTTWALLHGETEHGVTWHEMVAEVDAGRMLKQARFPVGPGDTTLALDVRCHEHALLSLKELLDDLEADALAPIAQDPAERTYFPARRLFPGGGLVTGEQPAAELDRWCRAGEFGRFDNRFGRPRIVVGDEAFLVTGLRPLPGPVEAEPGTVLAAGPERRLSTVDGSVELTKLSTVDGESVSPDAVLNAGDRLGAPGAVFTDWFEEWARREASWLDRLAACTGVPDRVVSPLWTKSPVTRGTTLVRRALVDRLRDPATELLTAWLVCLGSRYGTVRYSDDVRRAEVAGLEALVARDVPLPVELPPELGFAGATAAVAREIAGLRGSYLRDLPARYPLHGLANRPMPLALAVTGTGARLDPAPGTASVLVIDTATPAFHFAATEHLGPPRETVREFAGLARSVLTLIEAAADRPAVPLAAVR